MQYSFNRQNGTVQEENSTLLRNQRKFFKYQTKVDKLWKEKLFDHSILFSRFYRNKRPNEIYSKEFYY